MLAVVRNLAVILLSNHYIACVWFLIGSVGHDDEAGRRILDLQRLRQAECWVNREGLGDAELSLQYLVSIQWSLAQFTPGSSLTLGVQIV